MNTDGSALNRALVWEEADYTQCTVPDRVQILAIVVLKFDNMVKQDDIKPAATEWAISIVTASKNVSRHLFVNFRNLNVITSGHSYSLLRMDECIDLLREATIFPTLETGSSYWKIYIKQSYR